MRKEKKKALKTKKKGIKVISKPKPIALSRLNTKRVRQNLTKEEWVKFKIYCIDNDIQVYRKLAQLVKSFLKKINKEKKSI